MSLPSGKVKATPARRLRLATSFCGATCAFLIAAAPLFAASRNDDPPIHPELYRQAKHLITNGSSLPEAIELLDTIIEKNPKFGQAYVERGRAYAALEKFDEAKRDIDQAEKMTDSVDINSVYKARAFYYGKKNELKKALQFCTLALGRTPYDDGLHKQRAIIYEQLGMLELARKDRALAHRKILPNRLFKFQAGDMIEKGNLRGAIKVLDQGATCYPVDSDLYLMRGDLHIKLKEYDSGLKDFDKSISLLATTSNEVHGEPYLARGKEYLRRKKYAEAISDFSKGLATQRTRSKRELLELRSQAYEAAGKSAQAAADRKSAKAMAAGAKP